MSDGTTTAKHSSNRKNARRSTGPRSVEGKMRASQNAVRHGLARASVSISSDEIEILIRAIIGGACDFQTNALARRFAMAQAQVKRTKSVRDSYTLAFTQALDQGDTRVIADLLGRFSGLERYERAALAQRRFALRDLAAVSTSVLGAGSFAKRSQNC